MSKTKNDVYSVESFMKHISISMSDATVREYGNNLKYFLKFLDKHPKKITKSILMRFVYEMMSKKLSASMVLLRIAAIKKYYKYLIYFNAFNRVKFIDIFENLELPKVTQQKQKIYMASDVKNIVEKLEKCKTSFVSMQTLVFILIASTTGARRREISGVKITDVDFESNHIYFYKTKNKMPRVIKISEYLAAKIKEYLTFREKHVKEKTDMLFLSNKGYESNVENIAQNIITHCKKYNIHISFHAFRRGFASELSNVGVPIDKISKALGHASVSMTSSRYIYINEREMDDVVLSYTKRYENKDCEKVNKSEDLSDMISVIKMLKMEITRLSKITL